MSSRLDVRLSTLERIKTASDISDHDGRASVAHKILFDLRLQMDSKQQALPGLLRVLLMQTRASTPCLPMVKNAVIHLVTATVELANCQQISLKTQPGRHLDQEICFEAKVVASVSAQIMQQLCITVPGPGCLGSRRNRSFCPAETLGQQILIYSDLLLQVQHTCVKATGQLIGSPGPGFSGRTSLLCTKAHHACPPVPVKSRAGSVQESRLSHSWSPRITSENV